MQSYVGNSWTASCEARNHASRPAYVVVGLTVAKLYVHCRQALCGHRNDRTGGRRNCEACGHPLPKRRVPKHAAVLLELPYPVWAELSVEIHGGELDACGVCRKIPSDGRHHDRDHDHETGLPRGLACGGDFGCNRMMPRTLTAARAREAADLLRFYDGSRGPFAAYLPRDLDAARAEQIARYLERVESYYTKESAT